VKLANFTSFSSHEVIFTVSVDVSTPFLYMQLRDDRDTDNIRQPIEEVDKTKGRHITSSAGWFSLNNFLAEPQIRYKITYTSYHDTITALELETRIIVRSLNSLFFKKYTNEQ
jgi:hypothetical protein